MSGEARGALARLRRLARTPVALPHWFPRRKQRRRQAQAIVRESGVPEAIGALVMDIVKRTRLWRSEQADVADELLAHLRDGLDSGADPAALTSGFGEPRLAAKLIRRAMRRKRPLAWRAWRRGLQGMGALVGLLVIVYVYAFIRFFGGTPTITRDYLAELNAPARALAAQDRAWPVYRAALVALRDLPKEAWDARPDDPGWQGAAAAVEAHAAALAMVREATARPALGYVAGFMIDEADRVLWPDHQDNASPQFGLISIVLPYLAELRMLSRLLAVEMRIAAAAGDGALVEADFKAGLRMAGHARGVPTLISDLVSLVMLDKALDTLSGILAVHPQIFSEAQLHWLAHEVAALDRECLRVRLDGEKMWFKDFVQHVYSDDGNGDGHVTAAGLQWLSAGMPVDMHSDTRTYMMAPAVAMVMAGRREMAEMFDRLVDRAEAESAKPLWEQDADDVDREVDDMKRSLLGNTRYLLVCILMPAMGKTALHTELAAQRRDAVLVAIALELHHRRSGAWPESLDALVPDLLPAVPPDRFDGKPLRYRLMEDNPLLYSIGFDRDDDGGTPTAGEGPGPKRGDGDWILWQE